MMFNTISASYYITACFLHDPFLLIDLKCCHRWTLLSHTVYDPTANVSATAVHRLPLPSC